MLKAMNKKLSRLRPRRLLALVVALSLVMADVLPLTMPVAFSALIDRYAYENCVEEMTVFMSENKATFAEYLNTHFQSDKLNSELVDQAIDAYKEFRKAVWAELNNYRSGYYESAEQLQELDACIRLTEKAILEAKSMLKNHVSTTTMFKKTTILLDKYKAINKQLAELNFLIAQIVGAFATFSNKIQCYISNCLRSD